MAMHVDDALNAEESVVAEALRRSATPAAGRDAGRARAHTATLAAVRAQKSRGRIVSFPRRRMMSFALAAAAVLALVVAVQPAIVTGPVEAAFGLSGGSSGVKAEGRLASVDAADALASGKAKSEQRSDRTRFSVEVEDVASQPGTFAVRLLRDGAPVDGSAGLAIVVDTFGFGDLNLDSRDGDPVPAAQAGDVVEVVNGDGATILRATLAAK